MIYVLMLIAKSLTQTYLWGKHIFDTTDSTMESDAPDKVDEEDHIWESGCEVHYLKVEPNNKVQIRVSLFLSLSICTYKYIYRDR